MTCCSTCRHAASFLKGDATETGHITDTMVKMALAHPEVHFRLKSGARTTLKAPPHRDRLERARAVLGERIGSQLVLAQDRVGGVAVTGLLAAPSLAQTTSRAVHLFVGRRPVRDRGLLHALSQGYGELIGKGRYPVAVLFIDVPDPDVDVNVHPQKLEVRFADAQTVYAAVRHAVRTAVADAPWVREPLDDQSSPVRMEAIASHAPPWPVAATRMGAGYARERARSFELSGGAREARQVAFPVLSPTASSPAVQHQVAEGSGPAAPAPWEPVPDVGASSDGSTRSPVSGFFSQLRYRGQLDLTYLMCERDGELVLIDQHAAHERVEFQRLLERHSARSPAVQRLLFPQTVELSPSQAAAATDCEQQLAAVGYELEPFDGAAGSSTFALRAVPAGLRTSDPVPVLVELLDQLADSGGATAVDDRIRALFATIACHSVVRAGDVLSPREVEALLSSMDQVDFRANCPHGRPVLLRISVAEIARRFGRT